MFAICIETSHQKGMGHLFRCIHFVSLLKKKREPFIVLLNNHPPSIKILEQNIIPYRIVDTNDDSSDWETQIIKECNIHVWMNDRLNTTREHSLKINKSKILLATVDDSGGGVEFSDLHFTPMLLAASKPITRGEIFSGVDYLILNPEIAKLRRLRTDLSNLIVSLGGSDTHGVTGKIVSILTELKINATIHTGPGFEHWKTLDHCDPNNFPIISNVHSLIKEFERFDLAITGGGVTPFEANASGLPCIIVANESIEVPVGTYLDKLGSSIFASFHEDLTPAILEGILKSDKLNMKTMSQKGMDTIPTAGAENVYRKIKESL